MDALGVLASARKRQAEARWLLQVRFGVGQPDEWRTLLADARDQYLRTFRLDTSQSWALVQVIALTEVLDRDSAAEVEGSAAHAAAPVAPFNAGGGSDAEKKRRRKFHEQMHAATAIATLELDSEDPQRAVWAHSSLIELALLATRLPHEDQHLFIEGAPAAAAKHLDGLFERGQGLDKRKLGRYSLRAQLARYAEWWWADGADRTIANLARELLTTMGKRGVPPTLKQEDLE
jgi:hypothetical protein